MFHEGPPGPQPTWKRPVYLIASTIFGGLVGVVLTLLLGALNLHFALIGSPRLAVFFYALRAAGAIGGFFIGRIWWQIVYVERR